MVETHVIFRWFLEQVVKNDQNYDKRYDLILRLVSLARDMGFSAGFRIDPQEPDWPVAFVELPTGQVSWHLPQHPTPWDGHSTEEKFRRIAEFLEQ